MRPALRILSLAVLALATSLVCFAQQSDTLSSSLCRPMPKDLPAIREQAQGGDAVAEYKIGRSMLSPRPTYDEIATAMPWFQRSAEQGYAPAQYMFGGMFRDGRWRKPQQLIFWWTKAAEQGEVQAQLWLGTMYEQGWVGIKRDYNEAFKWLSKAAEQGDPDAQASLGQMYENGEGTLQDYALAAKWYQKAGEHVPDLGGAGQGRNQLALLYMNGKGVNRDYVSAYMWFALLGNPTTGQLDFAGNPAEEYMTASQIAEAQTRTKEWIQKHPAKPLCPSL